MCCARQLCLCHVFFPHVVTYQPVTDAVWLDIKYHQILKEAV